MAAHDSDAVGEAIGGSDHLPCEEEEHHGLEVEAEAIDDLRHDLTEDYSISDVEIVGIQSEGLDDLLLGNCLHHLGYVEDHGGCDAYDDERYLGPLIDSEDDEENGQEREGDDLIEEEDEAEEPGAKPWKETDMQSQDNCGNKKKEADEEAAAAGYGVLPDHGVMKSLPCGGVICGDVVILFCGLENGGTDPGNKLMSAGDDAIFRVFAMPADRGLHVESDTDEEDQAGECLGKQLVRPRLNVEWR